MLDNMRMVESAQNFDFTFHFLKDALLLDFLFIQNFDGNSVIGNFVYSHYTKNQILVCMLTVI